MMKNQLLAKKQYYEAKKIELLEANFDEEISAKVDEFRKEKEKEILDFELSVKEHYKTQQISDMNKIEHYLELIDILIDEAKQSDDVTASTNSSNNETIVRPMMSL